MENAIKCFFCSSVYLRKERTSCYRGVKCKYADFSPLKHWCLKALQYFAGKSVIGFPVYQFMDNQLSNNIGEASH